MIATKSESWSALSEEYEQTILANGLCVITTCMPHTRSAAVQFYIKVGARHEPEALSGISHFVEHMVFKGTQRRPNPVEISEAIEGVGGSLDACTDHEHTQYRALVPATYLHTALDVITDMLRSPTFAPEDVEKERAVILEEIGSTYDSPADIAELTFDSMLWGNHPLGRDVAGTTRSVRRIRRTDLFEHMARHYRPANMVISVAGNVTHSEVVEQVQHLWGDVDGGPDGMARTQAKAKAEGPYIVPPDPPTRGPHVRIYRKRTEQVNLIVGVPALPYTHHERYTQDVLDVILGGGMSSRLFVRLREELALAYHVGSFVRTYADVGALGVHAAVDNDALPVALDAIMGELRRIKEEGVQEVELRKVKQYIIGHTLLGLERSSHVAHWTGWQRLMLGRVYSVDEALQAIEAVTTDQVHSLAARLFTADKLCLAVVGPTRDHAELMEHLVI
jgi:predicted Zn-dependent peptidase